MNKNEIVLFEDGDLKLEVQVNPEQDTVWLTLNQISDLFERNKSTVAKIAAVQKASKIP